MAATPVGQSGPGLGGSIARASRIRQDAGLHRAFDENCAGAKQPAEVGRLKLCSGPSGHSRINPADPIKRLSSMRRKLTAIGLAGALAAAGLSLSILGTGTTQAAGSSGKTFIIPANDGYGVGDCVGAGSACGQVLADAWCEAQGFTRSASFGLAEATDVTGSVPAVKPDRPISITCAE
jgi:hypothetical protein